jgi:hypothetical protein
MSDRDTGRQEVRGTIKSVRPPPPVTLPEKKRAERAKNEQFPLFILRATATRSHRGIRPMVYILKGKVSWLRLVAIIWTASSHAAPGPAAGLRQSRGPLGKCSSCDVK